MRGRAFPLLSWFFAAVIVPFQQETPRFRVSVEAVNVDALVTVDGRPVAGLTAADFEVREDGVQQQLQSVSLETVPVSMVLALDLSESVAGERLKSLLQACRTAVGAMRQIDRAALITFTHEIIERVPFTSDRTKLTNELARLASAGGNTSLFDAVYAGLRMRPSGFSRTLLLVISDGRDTTSWLTAPNVLHSSRRSESIVYALVPAASTPPRPVDLLLRAPERAYLPRRATPPRPDRSFLDKLTESTGGRVIPTSTSTMASDLVDILAEFQSRYLLTYVSPSQGRRGWHEITVRVRSSGAVVRARPGYWRDS